MCNLSSEAREQICRDCMAFQATPAYKAAWAANGYGNTHFDREQVGRDFWYTRNHHGVGFWARDDVYGPHADALTAAAQRFCERSLYMGDDGQLYLA